MVGFGGSAQLSVSFAVCGAFVVTRGRGAAVVERVRICCATSDFWIGYFIARVCAVKMCAGLH